MSNNHSDILVLGGGPSGISAAIACKIANPNMSVRVIEKSLPYNKIGCVIRGETLSYIEKLEIDPKDVGPMCQFDSTSIMSIDRCKFEMALLEKAKNFCIDVVHDTICWIDAHEDKINRIKTKSKGVFTASYFIDATGQVSLIPRFLGLRKPSGTAFKALYTHFISNTFIETVKNRPVNSGFVWIVPLPYSDNAGKFKYQLMKVLKEDADTITHLNLLKSVPFLREIGFSEEIKFTDPCNVFSQYVRQYPSFIYENETSKGDNWIAIGDSDSTYFDRIFSGIDKAILDGIRTGEVVSRI